MMKFDVIVAVSDEYLFIGICDRRSGSLSGEARIVYSLLLLWLCKQVPHFHLTPVIHYNSR